MDYQRTVALTGLLLVTALLYGPALSSPFVYEDGKQPKAGSVMSFDVPGRGLSEWTHRLVGSDPALAHGVNVALHLVIGLLIAAVACALSHPTAAVLAAGTWWLHPLSAQSVNYVTARADLLVTAGVLLAVYGCLRWGWWLALAGAGIVLAAGSKEIGLVVVPLVGWTLLVCRRVRWVDLVVGVAAAVAVVLWAAWPSIWLLGGAQWASHDFIATQAVAVWRLLLLVVWPFGFSVDPDVWALATPAWRLVCGLLTLQAFVLAVVQWERRPLVTWAIGWVALCVAPRFLFESSEYLKDYHFATAWAGLSVLVGSLLAGVSVAAPQWRERIA